MNIQASLSEFEKYLRQEERSTGTIDKYLRDLRQFYLWLEDRMLSREEAVKWKSHLLATGCRPVTVNSKLAALNSFFCFLGRNDCRVKFVKVQRRLFREESRNLTRQEYVRLVKTARVTGQERLALLMESICATGIRVSEVRYLTMEAVKHGRAEIALKGKIRTILIPAKLCRRLLNYAKKQKIVSGEIFLTRNKTPLSRHQIWAEMKALCVQSGVEPDKVFPHNLRHLFATAFYQACKDLARLADVLGHSSIETTRIYLLTTGMEHAKQLECLRLIC